MGRELTPNRITPFTSRRCRLVVLCGISTCFQVLSPCLGQIAHALLTCPPLECTASSRNLPQYIPARLACVKHAASVRPEPGSNSDVQSLSSSAVPGLGLAKALNLSQQIRRLLSQKSDCSCILIYFAVSFSRIVFVAFCCRVRDNDDYYSNVHMFCQAFFASLYEHNGISDFPSL